VVDYTALFLTLKFIILIVFAGSVFSKFRDFSGFVQTIKLFDIVAIKYNKALAILLMALELFIPVCLIINYPLLLIIGFSLSLLLLIIFTFAIIKVLSTNKSISCNCFGSTDTKITFFTLIRNFILLVLITIALIILTVTDINSTVLFLWDPVANAVFFQLGIFLGLVIIYSDLILWYFTNPYQVNTNP
jgi:hypothetical protein